MMKSISWRALQFPLLFLGLAACAGNAHTCYKPVEAGNVAGQILVAVPCPQAGAGSTVRGYTK
jgi:hypothetical protein